ncbi:Pc16g08750 [Penicillium rubens Wisconsin 54-1255]|uniref:Pc16g08750 protein n=1 Tax=Penicillium rubens (strain ATCC 28089 / DSM 1075 / NRRL 1951 / Wisconsin 54-1255) TaxID=500485 RepID=B6H8B0_PENRW|nr:Pc16g08750 [Penicillium rubens Wisconsin 54-1255]
MPLTILSRSQLRELLHALSREEILNLQRNLADALREYSSGSQEKGCSAAYQPQRTAITRQNGCTTLFMPASTGQTIGIKMISLQDGGAAGYGESLPFALINAHELTAFRTALASLMMFNRRKKVRTLLVFGAGTQAYWHIRLALVLRGEDIRRVYIVNRSFDRAAKLLQEIYQPENTEWRGDVKFSAVSTDFGEYGRILKEHVRKADAIFCCTPSPEPLFPAEYLTSGEGRQKGRLICAIGSYKAHMAEIHPDILRDEVNLQAAHSHWHKKVHRSGVILVDSLDAALKEAGEIIQAGIKPKQVVELGELLMVRDATREAATVDEEKSLREWAQRGNVIYKSVGLGLMDLVTGGDLVRLARERKLGTTVEDF